MSEPKQIANDVEDEGSLDEAMPPSSVEVVAGDGWKRKLPLAILTLAPTLYLVSRIYLRTGDIGLALGAGFICPFCIYGALGAWLDGASAIAQNSWAQWSSNQADQRPLIFAIVAALAFVAIFSLMWLISPAVTSY